MARRYVGAYPAPNFAQLVNEVAELGLVALISGEVTASKGEAPLGAPKVPGKVVDAWFSVEESGKDDSNTLSLTLDVLINGTTCLSTNPVIAHVSGEASTNKTTKESGDTGITQGVISTSANTYNAGDVISYKLSQTRTASPTTEMSNAVVVVEIEPDV